MTGPVTPPPGARLLLGLLPEDLREPVLGDLLEEANDTARGGPRRARLWLLSQAIVIAAAFLAERVRRGRLRAETERPRKGDTVMGSIRQDLRYAARTMMAAPGFTAVAVLTLALGIGANTAMFSVLNTYVFRALPYPAPDRLVRVFRTSPHSQSWPHSAGNFFDHREQNDVFEHLVAFNPIGPNLSQPAEPAERLRGIAVTADFFDALGVRAEIGRGFSRDEEVSGADNVVVLSHRFWMRKFGGDPNVLGRSLRLDGTDVTVVGVMPPSAEHPLLWGNVHLWRPLSFTPEGRQDRGSNWLQAMGRLKPGVSIERAQDAMARLAASLAEQHPDNRGESLRLEPLGRSLSDDVGRNVMWFTFGLAGFVLLIACANLANLQLARTAARSREYAVRAALGAGRARLMRQSLTESLLVSLAGGALSLALAYAVVTFISRRLFGELPGAEVAVDLSVFGFALLCSVLTGLVFGIVPAWLASRADVGQALRQHVRGATSGRSHHHLRHALIVGEVAFALILLTGAGLFLKGLERFAHLDPGWQVDGLVTANVALQGEDYTEPARRVAFYEQLEERLRILPGVEAVALASSQPVWGFRSSGGVVVEGRPEPPTAERPEVFLEPVSTRYFEALGVRLLEGRAFTPQDTADRPDVVIINETMARRFWPGESAVGKRIGRGPLEERRWLEVVGVVDDMGFPGDLGEPYTRLQAFRPLAATAPSGGVTVMLRAPTAPEGLEAALRRTVADLDPNQAIYQVRTVRSLVEAGLGGVSLLGTMLGAFAALGLVLAVIGIYGVTAYTVTQRTGEIGIRMALGAQRLDVLWLILGRGASLSLLGVVLGIGGGYAIARLLESLVPTLPTRDPLTFGLIALGLTAVVLAACYLPARRATKVDPMVALRYE
jgi:predicted permease